MRKLCATVAALVGIAALLGCPAASPPPTTRRTPVAGRLGSFFSLPDFSSGGTATTLEGTPRGYGLGGAHVPGIPYDEYIRMTGAQWFPDLQRQKVDYWAGQVQGYTFERLFPASIGHFRGWD